MQVIVNVSVRDSNERAHPAFDLRVRDVSVKSADDILMEINDRLPEYVDLLEASIEQHLTIGAVSEPTDPDQ